MKSDAPTDLGNYGPDTRGAPSYQAGEPWGVCDRCARKYRRKDLKLEWTGLWVDAKCWDPRPPDMTPPVVWPEGTAIAYAKPEPPNIFIDVPPPHS